MITVMAKTRPIAFIPRTGQTSHLSPFCQPERRVGVPVLRARQESVVKLFFLGD